MSVPGWLQTLRSLRPAHVVAALPEGSSLLLLNPRDLRRADPAPLLRIGVSALFLVAPLLRAARDANALVGLASRSIGEGPWANHFASAVLRASDELGLGVPLYLATAPLPLTDGDRTGNLLQRHLDAGFTEIVFACPATADGLLESAEPVLAVLRERELPFTLAAPDADLAGPILDELSRAGFEAELVTLESAAGAGALAAGGIELPLEAVRAGLRGIDLTKHLASVAGDVNDGSDEAAQLRAEALVYAEAFRILSKDPFRGAAARAMRALAAQPGY